MDRFYFHVADGDDFTDLQGTLLPDIEAVRKEALRFASDLLENHAQFWSTGEWRMRVTDANDLTLFTLHFFASDGPTLMKSGQSLRDGAPEGKA